MKNISYILQAAKEKVVEIYSFPRSRLQLVDHPNGYGQIIVRARKVKSASVDFYSHQPLTEPSERKTLAECVAEIDACL
jgi:hypothetical protein